ncbi:uncharacterized protein [Rhodnius prolixus]|uniref:uncharacterized protein n=1 Tax=Rhodnius prolixus TaxID=13249 RepID=UPI003D18CA13
MNNCNKGAKLLYSVKEHLSLKEKEYQAVTVNDLLKSVQILEDADSRTVSCNRDKTDFGTLSNKLVKLSSLHNFNKNVLKQFQSEKPPGSQNSLNKNRIDYGPSCSNIPPTEKINSGCSNEVDERDTEALEEITNFKKCKKIIHSDENEVKASDQHSYRIEEVQENKDLSSVSGSGANSLNNVSEEILKILEKGSIAEHQVLDLDKKISSNKNPMDVFEKDIKLLPQKNVRDAVQSENSEQLLGILINDKIIRNNNIYPHQTLSLKSDLTSEQEKVEDNNLEIPAWNTSSPLKMENEFYGLTYTQLFNEDFTCSMKDLGQQNSIKTNDLNKCSGPLEILNRNKEKLNLLKPPQERDHFLNSSPERENKSSANHKNEPEDCLKTLEFPLDNKSATTSTLDEASVLGSNKAVFCTAGGKKVQVDSKSLDKVTSLFNDDAEILNDFIENVKEEFSKNYFHGTHLHESKNSCTLTPRTSLKVGKQSVNHSLPFKDAVSDYQTFNDSSNTFDILISEKGNPLKYELHENKNKRSEILSHSINPNGRMSVGIKAHPEKVRFNEVVESASPKTTDQNHSPSCWKQQLESEQFPSFAAERKLNSKSLDNTKLSRNEDIKIIGDAFDKNCSLMNNVVEQKNLQFSKIPHSIVSVAREKSIAIDSDSLDKTRLVLNEDNKDSVVINNHCLKQNILKPKQLPISKTIPFAFTTAGGKSVDVDSKSLEKAKLLIDEVIVDDVSNVSEQKKIQRTKNIPFAFTTAGGRSVDVDSKSLEKAKLLIDEVIVDDVSNVSEQKKIQRTKNIPFAFTTAGGRSVDVDSKSLEKAKLLIDEVIVDDVSNVSEQKQIQRTKNIPFAFTTAGGKSVDVDSKSLEKAKLLIDEVIVDDVSNVSEQKKIQRTKNIPFAFTTAGGRSVDVDSKSLEKAKLLIDEVIVDDVSNVSEQKQIQRTKNIPFAFTTAGGKSVDVDSKSLEKAKLLIDEVIVDDVSNVNEQKQIQRTKNIPFAFTTAGGRSVNVDSKSLEKAKLLIEEVIVDDVSNVSEQKQIQRTKNIPFAFTTAGGKSVDVDSKSLEKAKLLIEEVFVDDVSNVNEQKQIQRTKSIPFAFTTAGGKSVDVDSKSLEKAKLLIEEVIVDDVSNVSEKMQIQRTKSIPFAFTTAGGKSVDVDSKSLETVKLLIEEVFVDDVSNVSEQKQIQRTESIPFAFSTAGGKNVNIHSKSLDGVRVLFEDDVEDTLFVKAQQNKTQSLKSGKMQPLKESKTFRFSAASGKLVAVDSVSVGKVTLLLKDERDSTVCDSDKLMYSKTQIVSKLVNADESVEEISDKAFENNETLNNGYEEGNVIGSTVKTDYMYKEMKDSNLLAGTYFTHSTSSGKIVSVDSKCLDKVRLPFKDDEGIALDNEGTVPPILKNQTQNVLYKVTGSFDFSSADDEKSGKVVRQIVDGVEFLDRADAVKECDASSSPALPSAFSTASGKSVKFDSESLCKVKSLFNEESMYGKELVLKSKAIPTRNKLETNKMVLFKTECSVEPATASKQSYFRITDEDIADLVTADVEKCSTLQNVKFSSKQSVHSCNVNEDRMSTVSGNSVNRALFQEMPASELTTENRDNRLDDNLVLLNKKYDEDVIKMVENHSTEEKKDILGIDSLNCIMLLIDEEKNERDLNEIHLNLKCLIENEKCGFNLKDSEYNPLTDKNEGKLDSFKNSTDVHAKVEYLENEAIVPSYENEEREETKNVAHKENSKSCNENINSEEVRNRKFPYANSDGENSQMSGMSLFHEVSESAAALMVDEQLNGTWRTRGIVTSPSMLVERSKPKVSIITLNENEKTGFTTITNRMANLAYTPSRRKISEKRKVYGEDEIQEFKKPKVDLFTTQIEELCKKSQQQQKELINQKFKAVIKPEPGLLFIQKQEKSRLSLRQKVRGLRPCKYTEEQLLTFGLKKEVIDVNSNNSSSFQFDAKEYYKEDIDFFTTGLRVGQESYLLFNCHLKAGLVEIENCLLSSPGVDPKLLPNGWVANHYRWIVWKLASMEKSFPDIFGGRCLNPDNVLQQLKYRYDREIDRAQRAAFKKISEGDESASRLFICCVAAIRKNVSEIEETTLDLELTDGWYSLWASVDQEMVGLVNKNIVCVGSKLAIMGADSLTPDQACDPLKAQCRLKISTNSCRRARWDAKMGFVNVRCFSSLKLSSILPQGGIVGKISALVARVYPILHMSKDSEGKTVFRNERTESAEEARNEKIYIEKAEELYEQVWSEVEQKYKKPVDVGQYTSKDIKSLSQPDILCNIIEQSCDSATQGLLSNEQLKLAADYRDQMLSKIRQEVQDQIKIKMRDILPERHVVKLLKVRILDYEKEMQAMLTIWRPTEEICNILRENKIISFTNLCASGTRDRVLQLTNSRQTRYQEVCTFASDKFLRKITRLAELKPVGVSRPTGLLSNEVDIVGLVVYIKHPDHPKGLTVVYLTNLEGEYIAISFWTALKVFGCEDILTEDSLVCCYNLQWRSGSGAWRIPNVFATELSVFTQHPKFSHLKQEFSKINSLILCEKSTDLIKESKLQLLTLLKKREYSSIGNSSSGVQMEHITNSVNEADVTPVQKKIRKLSNYGRPPPLSPLPLFSRSPDVFNDFRSPCSARAKDSPKLNNSPLSLSNSGKT